MRRRTEYGGSRHLHELRRNGDLTQVVVVSRNKTASQEFWSLCISLGWMGIFPVPVLSQLPIIDTRWRSHPCSTGSGGLGLRARLLKKLCWLPDPWELLSVKRRSKTAPCWDAALLPSRGQLGKGRVDPFYSKRRSSGEVQCMGKRVQAPSKFRESRVGD